MKFREVFRYDLAYHLRNPVTWAYAAIPLGLAFLIIGADADSAQTIKQNAPEAVAEMMIMWGLVGMGISAGLFGDAAVRDAHARMDALLYTTALRKIDYLGGRFPRRTHDQRCNPARYPAWFYCGHIRTMDRARCFPAVSRRGVCAAVRTLRSS